MTRSLHNGRFLPSHPVRLAVITSISTVLLASADSLGHGEAKTVPEQMKQALTAAHAQHLAHVHTDMRDGTYLWTWSVHRSSASAILRPIALSAHAQPIDKDFTRTRLGGTNLARCSSMRRRTRRDDTPRCGSAATEPRSGPCASARANSMHVDAD
jgi:hypothetical protein